MKMIFFLVLFLSTPAVAQSLDNPIRPVTPYEYYNSQRQDVWRPNVQSQPFEDQTRVQPPPVPNIAPQEQIGPFTCEGGYSNRNCALRLPPETGYR